MMDKVNCTVIDHSTGRRCVSEDSVHRGLERFRPYDFYEGEDEGCVLVHVQVFRETLIVAVAATNERDRRRTRKGGVGPFYLRGCG